MYKGRFGHLWFAAVAIIVGGGGLLERRSELSLLSMVLGIGLGIWLQWLVEKVEGRNRATKEIADETI